MATSVKIQLVPVRYGPARVHSKRRGSASYHRRVQKKWITRYGMVDTTPLKKHEAARLDPRFTFGFGEEVLLIREDDAMYLNAMARAAGDPPIVDEVTALAGMMNAINKLEAVLR